MTRGRKRGAQNIQNSENGHKRRKVKQVKKADSPNLTEAANAMKGKRFKKKSKMKPKKSANIAAVANKDVVEEKKALSSNWQAFMKELGVQKKKVVDDKKGIRYGQKRKFKGSQITQEKSALNKVDTKKVDENVIRENEIWFDDVDIEDIENALGKKIRIEDGKNRRLVDENDKGTDLKDDNKPSITKRLAIDCEMVGVGMDGKDNMLARVSIVNAFGETVYDSFVAPMQKVVDYRTKYSGVRPENLINAPTFHEVQKAVANITEGKILVGHALHNDLKVLLLSHSRKNIRDTSSYKPFKRLLKTRFPSLKNLTKEVLNIDIQSGEHSSVEDARCTMKIYQLHKRKWERDIKDKGYKKVIARKPLNFIKKDTKKNVKRIKEKRFQKRIARRNKMETKQT